MCLALFSYACVDCALRIGFLDDGDKLHDSTLPYAIFVVVVLFLQLDMLCLVDSHQ
jgi:hypothetical protein